MNMTTQKKVIVLSDYGHLSLSGVLVEVAHVAAGEEVDLYGMYGPSRWAATLRVLISNTMEVWAMFGFLYADQYTNNCPIEDSYRKFCNTFDCPISNTTSTNFRQRYRRLIKQVYEQERLISNIDFDKMVFTSKNESQTLTVLA